MSGDLFKKMEKKICPWKSSFPAYLTPINFMHLDGPLLIGCSIAHNLLPLLHFGLVAARLKQHHHDDITPEHHSVANQQGR